MKKIIFFFALTMLLPCLAQTQPVEKFCPFGDKYYPKCDDKGNWEKCMEGMKDGKAYRYVAGLEGTSKTCVCEKLRDHPDVVSLKKALAKLKASDAEQYKKLAQLAEKNDEQDTRLNDHEIRIKGLEKRMDGAEEEIKNLPKAPVLKQEEVADKKEEEVKKSSPYIPPPPPPTDTAKADTITNGRLFFIIDPFAFVSSNRSPAFPSKVIWGGGIETGISIIWKERLAGTATVGYLFTPSFIPETGYSAYGVDKVSIHGLTLNARVGYKFLPFLGINGGYSWSPKKELPQQGAFLYLETATPLRRMQILLQGGVDYFTNLNFFGRGTLRFNF